MGAPDGWCWGIDSSYDTLTHAKVDALLADGEGIKVFAQCLWTGAGQPGPAQDNIRLAASRGLWVLGYISLAPGHPGNWHVAQALAVTAPDVVALLSLLPIDFELQGVTLDDILAGLQRLHATPGLEQIPPVIYTNYNSWVAYLNNPNWPSGIGRWDAGWDGNPFNATLMYGNMPPELLMGMQYTGGEDVDGQFADRDLFKITEVQPLPVPTPQKVIDGVGVHYTDGSQESVWP